jgi:uncharacterized protein YndB with AHSA1/START domain
MSTDKNVFAISHTFNAPRERVYKAWADKDQSSQWFGPKGSKASYKHFDFRSGGYSHYCLDYQGVKMWGKASYREIVPNESIVYVNSFSDEQGDLGTHPLAPTWPREMLTTITFADAGKDKTKVNVEWIPIKPSPEETKTFAEGHDSMNQGWSGTFEQLEEYLAKTQSKAA